MNVAMRAWAVLVDPAAEWARIAQEPGDSIYLLTRYVAALAVVPALSGLVGACLIGVIVPGSGPVRAPLSLGILGAMFGYAEVFAVVVMLALFVRLTAPLFGDRRNFTGALQLAAYSTTPAWLAGIFLLLPGLRFLNLLGLYGAYVLALGLPRPTAASASRSAGFVALITLCAGLLMLLAAAARTALFGPQGI